MISNRYLIGEDTISDTRRVFVNESNGYSIPILFMEENVMVFSIVIIYEYETPLYKDYYKALFFLILAISPNLDYDCLHILRVLIGWFIISVFSSSTKYAKNSLFVNIKWFIQKIEKIEEFFNFLFIIHSLWISLKNSFSL